MDDMPNAAAHAKPQRSDHLWVLFLIAVCCLAETWASWVGIGALSGFPKLGRMPTDWTLAVVVEAYWGYALYAWLAASPGQRSRRFAMWSAAAVFVLSLIGQAAYHLAARAHAVPSAAVVVFVTALPVVVLALIAVLVHLRHLDRAGAAEAVAATAAAQELAAVRAELDAERAALQPLRDAFAEAEAGRDEAVANAEALTRKLEAVSAQRKRKRTAQKPPAKSAQEDDLTTEARALTLLDEDPSLRGPRMGGELARRLGVSPPTGRRLHAKLTAQDRSGDSLNERSADQSGERS